jgi:glycosyltransferase involved in cell wall biosynthesis
MRIAIINIPVKAPWLGNNKWITVPPQGYGGIQWVVTNIIDGLLALGHEIFLLGAPGSIWLNPFLHVIDAGDPESIYNWLNNNKVDIIHDHSNGLISPDKLTKSCPFVSTHHLTGRPLNPSNTVYISYSQAQQAKATNAPIIRLPVNPSRYCFNRKKENYLLYLGRVSAWKGVLEAAAFAAASGLPLKIAGPVWEKDYLKSIKEKYSNTVILLGETSGDKRLELLAGAKALMVLSQPVQGPWGCIWNEPGATVVSEAAVSGTPVISTANGCLKEIVPLVGKILDTNSTPLVEETLSLIEVLPSADKVRDTAIAEWGHIKICKQYENLYKEVIKGKQWQ